MKNNQYPTLGASTIHATVLKNGRKEGGKIRKKRSENFQNPLQTRNRFTSISTSSLTLP
jgi:hypothetical protein